MSIPKFLIDMLNNQYGVEITNQIIKGYEYKRPVTLRVNNLKSNRENVEKVFESQGIEFEKVNWCNEAYIIKKLKEKDLQELDIYKNGEIYLQSLSSMLPPILMDAKEGEDILDMCAAPGGKTSQIAALVNNNAHITACEMNTIRFDRLKYNVEKQGATSVYVMKEDSRNINDYFLFDRILLDSPCSGSGTLNIEDNNLEKYFTEKLIEKCTKSQLILLRKALKILKPGHEMIYSTCSILKQENEDILDKVIKETNTEVIPIEFEEKDSIELLPVKIKGTLCIKPNELYEGFFIAKIKRK